MGVFNVIFLLTAAALTSGKEYMPVLVWSSQSSGKLISDVSAFAKISTNEFSDHLAKKVKFEKPTVLLFMEENLSSEDFSWRDTDGNGAFPLLRNITKSSGDLTYLPAVQDPIKGLESLKMLGYLWKPYNKKSFQTMRDNEKLVIEVKLKEPEYLDDRPDMLRTHDEQIATVYNDALSHNTNILAVYSGHHNSWIDNEVSRLKRQVADSNTTNDLVIEDDKGMVKMSVTPPILYETKEPGNKSQIVKITKVMGIPTIDVIKDTISMTVKFSFPNNAKYISVKFEFTSIENEWWTMDSAEILDFKLKNLIPSVPVGGPSEYSFFCNPTVVFGKSTASLTFENLQVQPRVGKGNPFGPVMHCIPYFSIAIWSGLIVVVILSVVLGWGIVMIMDINTNDRFDDPKGKTITITAAD
ncbi:hypothetical protein RUM43_012859 [Polyplax serrata]|uniref:V-type proton ATPase subunit S1 n=1 Tax=Polyplax serrata TaxID=468196 RepID=A0AAN8Q378_POLSC